MDLGSKLNSHQSPRILEPEILSLTHSLVTADKHVNILGQFLNLPGNNGCNIALTSSFISPACFRKRASHEDTYSFSYMLGCQPGLNVKNLF